MNEKDKLYFITLTSNYLKYLGIYENKIIWNISEIIKREQEAYTGVDKISENIIEVSLFTGINYKIDVMERKILEKRIVK